LEEFPVFEKYLFDLNVFRAERRNTT